MTEGCLIAIEGIDGAGTTTQTKLLGRWLADNHFPHSVICEPAPGPIRFAIAQGLSNKLPMSSAVLARLFAADRLLQQERFVSRVLAAGHVVVSDRSVVSSYVYQHDQVSYDELDALNRGVKWPDVVVFLDVPADTALKRIANRSSHSVYENRNWLAALEKEYLSAQLNLSRRSGFINVNGVGAPAEITRRIVSALSLFLDPYTQNRPPLPCGCVAGTGYLERSDCWQTRYEVLTQARPMLSAYSCFCYCHDTIANGVASTVTVERNDDA